MLKTTALSLFNEHLNFFLSSNEGVKVLATLDKEFQRYRVENRMVDGIDIDNLMNIMLFEFIEQRKRNMKNLRALYSRNYNLERGNLHFTKFQILTSD